MIDPLENGTISLIFGLSGQLLTHSMLVYVNPVAPVPGIHKKKHWGAERPAPKRSTDGPGTQDTVVLWIFQTRSKMLRFCGKRQNNAFIPASFFPMSFCSTVNVYFPRIYIWKKKNLQLARCSLGKLLKNHLLGCGKFVAFLPVVAILPGPSKSTWGSRETGWDQTDWIWMEVNLDRLRKLWNFSNKKCWCLYGKTPNLMKFVCNKIYLHISMCICSIFASIHYIRYVSGVQTLSTNQEYSCKTSCSQHPSKEVAHVNWWGQ